MRRFRPRHLRRVQDLAVRAEGHADVMIGEISRLRGRDSAECGEKDLKKIIAKQSFAIARRVRPLESVEQSFNF